jgi:hypothetical protein
MHTHTVTGTASLRAPVGTVDFPTAHGCRFGIATLHRWGRTSQGEKERKKKIRQPQPSPAPPANAGHRRRSFASPTSPLNPPMAASSRRRPHPKFRARSTASAATRRGSGGSASLPASHGVAGSGSTSGEKGRGGGVGGGGNRAPARKGRGAPVRRWREGRPWRWSWWLGKVAGKKKGDGKKSKTWG